MSETNKKKREWNKFLFTIFGLIISLAIFGVIYLLYIIQNSIEAMGSPLIPKEYIQRFVNILPGPLWSDTILLYLFPILIFLIFLLIAPYTTIFLIKLHQLIYRSKNRFNYGIINLKTKVNLLCYFDDLLLYVFFHLVLVH